MSEKLAGETVAFGQKLAASQAFSALFREGMALVEETAAYLDGAGGRMPRSSSAARRLPMPPKACG